ncbi:MAG TPA: hypothetical protein VG755_44975 [Nannocystaceae bacterium]|nr:hypothetical protein [Nannocystaceae bacterium]
MRTRILPFALLLAACSTDDPAQSDDDDGADTSSSDDGTAQRVRFHEDVAPILAASCNGCHQEGGVAPFALDSYDAAVQWSGSIVAAIESRTMPPFNVDNSGACNTYRDARWLDDESIATITDWVSEGLERGDAALGMPQPPAPRTLDGDDIVVVGTPENYQPINEAQPAAPADDYQCFLVDPQTDDTSFLVGYDVVPGNAAIVHHVLAFDVDPERAGMGGKNGELMAALDAQSPDQPGWDCFNAAGDGVWVEGVPVTWAPGAGATKFPEGTGIRIAPGHKLVVQMHYHLTEQASPDTTEIQLAFADEVEREAHSALMDGFLMTLIGSPAELPAGKADASFEWSIALKDIPGLGVDFEHADMFGVLPHMHQRGRKMTVDFVREDGEVCGARVDNWDYDWQQAFYYDAPIPVEMTDEIAVRCEWDTRADSEPVLPGLGTDAEMCLVGVYLVERAPA